MKERKLTCIVCPKGCEITVKFDKEGKIDGIEGNACKRGEVYAESECTAPVRTVTSTVRCLDGGLVSVKTSVPVPKEKIFEVMGEVNSARAENDVKIGDTVIKNVANTGSDIIATSSR